MRLANSRPDAPCPPWLCPTKRALATRPAGGLARFWVLRSFLRIYSTFSSSVAASVTCILCRDLIITRERFCCRILRQTRAQIQPHVAHVSFQSFGCLGVAHALGSQTCQNAPPEPGCQPIKPAADAGFVQPQGPCNFGERLPIKIIGRQCVSVLWRKFRQRFIGSRFERLVRNAAGSRGRVGNRRRKLNTFFGLFLETHRTFLLAIAIDEFLRHHSAQPTLERTPAGVRDQF